MQTNDSLCDDLEARDEADYESEKRQEASEVLSRHQLAGKGSSGKLSILAAMAAMARTPTPTLRDWSLTDQDRPLKGVAMRRKKAKAARKAKQSQRRKNR